MTILKGYLMPHAPVFIKDIGRGQEFIIDKTVTAMMEIGKEIASFKPDTVFVITPHGTVFSDGVAILYEEKLQGDLGEFGSEDIKFNLDNDIDLINLLKDYMSIDYRISSALLDKDLAKYFNVSYRLDHGSMVPLYFILKHISKIKVVSMTYGTLSSQELYKIGMSIEKAAAKLGKNIVVIASGDMSHALKDSGPYSFDNRGPIFDQSIKKFIDDSNPLGIMTIDDKLCLGAKECGRRSLQIMLGVFEGNKIISNSISYEGPFGVGYLTAKFTKGEIGDSILKNIENFQKKKIENTLKNEDDYVTLARKTIEGYIREGKKIDYKQLNLKEEMLNTKHGVFVTIHDDRGLRGCIGTYAPTTENVAKEIVENAIKSATKDPRFDPLEINELDNITISVDILMESVRVDDIKELDPKEYGIIVRSSYKSGLLLPDLDGVDTVQKQIEIVKSKAGITDDEEFTLERFSVIRHH